MTKREKGTRVVAIRDSDPETKTLYVWGVGEYQGDEVPPPEIGGFNMGFPNPKILLDSGEVVWGCECWWGPEDQIAKYEEAGFTVEYVSLAEDRARHAAT